MLVGSSLSVTTIDKWFETCEIAEVTYSLGVVTIWFHVRKG